MNPTTMSSTTTVPVDERRALRDRLLAGDFPAVAREVESALQRWQTEQSQAAYWGLQDRLQSLCNTRSAFTLPLAEQWRAQSPDEPMAHLVHGLIATAEATRHRGQGSASSLDATGWQAVDRHFAAARESLLQVWTLPLMAGPATDALMQRELIRGHSETEALAQFDHLLAHDAQFFAGWNRRLAQLEPRWGGSWPEVEALLRRADTVLRDPLMRDSLHARALWWRADHAWRFEDEDAEALALIEQGLARPMGGWVRSSLLQLRSDIHAHVERHAEAVQALREAVAAQPDNPTLHLALGRRLEAAEQMPAAFEAWAQGVEREGDDAHECAYQLGFHLMHGLEGMPPDSQRAESVLRAACQTAPTRRDRAWCELALGDLYRVTTGFMDRARAEAAYQAAGEGGLPQAWTSLARGLDEGVWGTPDPVAATAAYRQAAEAGDNAARDLYARRLLDGVGCAPDRAAALPMLRAAGDEDHVEALLQLAATAWHAGQTGLAELWLWRAAAASDDNALDATSLLVRGMVSGWFGYTDRALARTLLNHAIERASRYDHRVLMLGYALLYPDVRKDGDELAVIRKQLRKIAKDKTLLDVYRADARRQLAALPGKWTHTLHLSRPDSIPMPSLPDEGPQAAFAAAPGAGAA